MADVLRLAIIYDTSQAAAKLTDLDSRLTKLTTTSNRSQVVFRQSSQRWATASEIMASMATSAAKAGESLQQPAKHAFSLAEAMGTAGAAANVSTARLRGVANAGLRLAAGLASGNLSAAGLASAMSRLAGPLAIGAVIISVINVVNALKEYRRISQDVEDTVGNMASAARDASEDVRRMLGEAPAETPAERAIKRIRDAVRQMRQEATRLGGPAGEEINRQADVLERQLGGIGKRASLLPAREAAKSLAEYNRQLVRQSQLLDLLNAGPFERMEADLAISKKRLEDLVNAGKGATQEAQLLAYAIGIGAKRLADLKRAAALMTGGLNIMADSLEQFVIEGTASFTDFLNNILRLLYRDATDSLISGIVGRYVKSRAGGPTGGGTEVSGSGGPGAPSGSVVSNVTYQVQAMDAQGVAQFFQRNAGQMAAEVTRQATRSRGMRKALTRG